MNADTPAAFTDLDHEMLAIEADERTRRARVFTTHSADEVANMPPPTFLVDGVIPEVGTGVITGFGGVGKSFLGIDVGACVSLGIPWQGYATKRRPVLIVSLEGAPGPRVEAWKQHHGYNALPDLHFLLETLDLRDKRDADGLLYTADKIDARLERVV